MAALFKIKFVIRIYFKDGFVHLFEYKNCQRDAANDQADAPGKQPHLSALFAQVDENDADDNTQYCREYQHVIAGILGEYLGRYVFRVTYEYFPFCQIEIMMPVLSTGFYLGIITPAKDDSQYATEDQY